MKDWLPASLSGFFNCRGTLSLLLKCDVAIGDTHLCSKFGDQAVQFSIHITFVFLASKGLCKLQVENGIFLALKKVLIDLRTRDLEHLDSIY